MPEAIRTQVDGLNEIYSLQTALDCSDMPDMTRQEFKDETDVNKILARYGVDGVRRPVEYSEIDYDVDLQQSLESIREAERAIAKLPASLRSKYSSWEQLLAGVDNGALAMDLAVYHDEKAAAEKAALDAAAGAALASRQRTP